MKKGLKIVLASIGVLLVGLTGYLLVQHFTRSVDTPLKVIPGDAAAVLKIDIRALAGKSDFMKLMQEPAFKKVPESGKASLRQLLSDPFGTGIDPLGNVYGFLAKDGENTVSAIVFNVSDADDLSTFIQKLGIGRGIDVESGIYYSGIDDTHCICWNSDAGIILASTADAKSIATNYLEQNKEQSLLSNADYKTFSEKTFDIGLYLNNTSLTKMSSALTPVASFADGHGEVLINFENDKISAAYTNYPKTGSAPFNLFKDAGFAPGHFEAIAPKTPLAVLGISADQNSIFSALENEPGMKDNLADLETYLEISDADARKLFNGDVSIAFTDFRDISNYDPRIEFNIDRVIKTIGAGTRQDLAFNVPMAYVTIGITDDDKMNSIISKLGMQKTKNFFALPGLDMIVYAAAKNGHLLVTNDYYAADSLSQNGKFDTKLPAEINPKNPFLLWADLNQKHFPPAFTDALKETYSEQAVDFFLKAVYPFQNLKMEKTTTGSELDLVLKPGEGNSLYRLLSYYGTLAN